MRRVLLGGSVLALVAAIVVASGSAALSDTHTLVRWTRVGDIRLGEPMKDVTAKYGAEKGSGYHLHGGTVLVGSWWPHSGVTEIYFTTRYYRTPGGWGVGSTFPKSWRSSFIRNPKLHQGPCGCWVKVGTGKRSLAPSTKNFGKPWVIVYIARGKVTGILLSSKYVD